MQESVKSADIPASLSSDCSSVSIALKNDMIPTRKGLGKFNCLLLSNDKVKTEMKTHISNTLSRFDQQGIFNSQVRWEFLIWNQKK